MESCEISRGTWDLASGEKVSKTKTDQKCSDSQNQKFRLKSRCYFISKGAEESATTRYVSLFASMDD